MLKEHGDVLSSFLYLYVSFRETLMVKLKFSKLHSSAEQKLPASFCWKLTADEEVTKTCMGFRETFKPHYPE